MVRIEDRLKSGFQRGIARSCDHKHNVVGVVSGGHDVSQTLGRSPLRGHSLTNGRTALHVPLRLIGEQHVLSPKPVDSGRHHPHVFPHQWTDDQAGASDVQIRHLNSPQGIGHFVHDVEAHGKPRVRQLPRSRLYSVQGFEGNLPQPSGFSGQVSSRQGVRLEAKRQHHQHLKRVRED